MKFSLGLVICFVVFIFTKNAQAQSDVNRHTVEEYYWRDYDGTIPKDAVEGGIDKAGRTTYIGQVVHDQNIVQPGQIHPIWKNISYAWDGKPYITTKFIKILCSAYLEKFEWIPTSTPDIRFILHKKYFVSGGYDLDYPLWVGRAIRKDQRIVGKITIRQPESVGFVEDGKAIYEKSFEVLTFNKDAIC